MKLVCYIKEGHEQLAILSGNSLYDMDALHPELPSTMSMFLNYWEDYFPLAKRINESIEQGKISLNIGLPADSVALIAPIPFPASCRRAIPFNQETHAYPYPAFNFINHHSVQGPGTVSCMPDYFRELDFEMSVAIVVNAHCRNITAEEADQYIGGYMIMNSVKAHNSLVSKDVACTLGPWLVSADELEPYAIDPREGSEGKRFSVEMKCRVNGELLIERNLANMDWTFAEILESCAYGADLQPGDIIIAGTIGTGHYRELNQAGKETDPEYVERWLQKDDIVEIEIEGLGLSRITIAAEDSEFSLFPQ